MKTYYVRFGSGDPRSNVGLSPTFLMFNNYGTAVTPPGITSVLGATGFYAFQYGTTTPIVFLIDGATTGLDSTSRYVSGAIDPADRADEYATTLIAQSTTLTAIGSTNTALITSNASLTAQYGQSNIALGTTNVALNITITSIVNTLGTGTSQTAEILLRMGSTSSTFGSDSIDPVDIFGYLKRLQEFNEGNQTFDKVSGAWAINTRGNTLLATKSLQNSSTQVSKS